MRVTILSHEEATTIVADRVQQIQPQVTKNFFDVFGTTGCLLNCQDEGNLERDSPMNMTNNDAQSKAERKSARTARKLYIKASKQLRQEWFTASQIIASAASGCGTCYIFDKILRNTFYENQTGSWDQYQYSLTRNFVVKRRPLGQQTSVEVVQYYQPLGSSVRFWQFARSNFLFGGDLSFTRLHTWMNDCLNNHSNCSKQSTTWDDSSRPARLLDLDPIQINSKTGIRLIETQSGRAYQYACLSHRCDDALMPHKTSKSNISNHLQFIDPEKLPKNFCDAVLIARNLNIRYLWIDSLCIIQHGDNGDDLSKELAKMGFIYRRAYLTIAAMSSPGSSEGCFIKDKWPDKCFMVSDKMGEDHLIGARILDQKGNPSSNSDINTRYPLLFRGWVFQERLMSTRLLLCSYGEFSFECLESSHCECESSLAPHILEKSWWASTLWFSQSRRFLLQNEEGARDLQRRGIWNGTTLDYWKTGVEKYMQHNLSFTSDVLPAIAGCAQLLAPRLQFTYVAGMWKETLATDMMWYILSVERPVSSRPRPRNSTAPSWSWASVAMGQSVRHIDHHRGPGRVTSHVLLESAIKEVDCKPESSINPFGKLEHAYLKIHAKLYPWYLRLFCRDARKEIIPHRHHWLKDMYVERALQSVSCHTNPKELDLCGALLELRFDGSLGDEEDLEFTSFENCIGLPSHACRLVRIYLLHVMHREYSPKTLDVFLVLGRAAPVNGMNNCYRRIALMKLTIENDNVCTWDRISQGRIKPQHEKFWLL